MPILVDCASKTPLENHANFALNFFKKKETRVVYCLNALFFDYLKVRGNHRTTERQGKGEKKPFDHFF